VKEPFATLEATDYIEQQTKNDSHRRGEKKSSAAKFAPVVLVKKVFLPSCASRAFL
jgi:hypothetical protein